MKEGPVVLNCCYWPSTKEMLYVVSEDWWRRFLLSQEVAINKRLTSTSTIGVSSVRGTGTNGSLEKTGREEIGRPVQI
jgi:hypothetical protein